MKYFEYDNCGVSPFCAGAVHRLLPQGDHRPDAADQRDLEDLPVGREVVSPAEPQEQGTLVVFVYIYVYIQIKFLKS